MEVGLGINFHVYLNAFSAISKEIGEVLLVPCPVSPSCPGSGLFVREETDSGENATKET